MSYVRSYLSKNNTIIKDNQTNNSQNPVTELLYGTENKIVSRFIFDIDLSNLQAKIASGIINPQRMIKHVLHMTNTISYAQEYIGKKSYTLTTDRASSFTLKVFNINQDWDEGSGYDFIYNDDILNYVPQASNWFSGKTAILWTKAGLYLSGVTQIIGSERFENGSESINIDITDYVNQRLLGTGYTGTSVFTGTSYGLGIKYDDIYEQIATEFRQAVAFHTRNTNTFYEPYIETIIDDNIIDDRNYFFLDKDNYLYLYSNASRQASLVVNKVNIYDYNDELIDVISGNSIIKVNKGIYKIKLNIDSSVYPDAVLFRDEWLLTVNGKSTTYNGEFYLISQDNYYTFNQSDQINLNNYFFYFWGIGEKEYVNAGDVRKIKLTIKELYPNQDNCVPLDIEYRLFTTVGRKYEIEIIPYTVVNRTYNGYEFDLDTSWLIPQDYYLQIRLKNGNYYENKQTLSFTVVSDGIILI